jgi:hypothetical protein
MSMMRDAEDTTAPKEGDQPTARRDTPPERSSPLFEDSDTADHGLSVSTLVEQCRWEIRANRRGELSNEGYGKDSFLRQPYEPLKQ